MGNRLENLNFHHFSVGWEHIAIIKFSAQYCPELSAHAHFICTKLCPQGFLLALCRVPRTADNRFKIHQKMLLIQAIMEKLTYI